MENKLDKYEKAILEMTAEWLKSQELPKEEVKMWFDISIGCVRNAEILKKILNQIETKESIADEARHIEYTYKEEKHFIKYREETAGYEKDKIVNILKGLVSIFEKILPVGTVVLLKEKYYEKLKTAIEQIEEIKREFEEKNVKIEEMTIMIVKRFVKVKEEEKYCEYAGYVHPIGLEDDRRMFIFTNKDIEEVLHEGYNDEKEKSYVCMMKKALVVDMKKTSIGL